jgi:Fungal specific transcription factor domain
MTSLTNPRFLSQDHPCNYTIFHSEPSHSSLAGISYQSTELSLSHLLNSTTATAASSDSSTPFHMFGLRRVGLDHCGDVFPRALPRAIQDRSDSPEVLFSRFREQICPMLSITGSQNDKWQTWILPRMQSSESLPHTISAITALQVSTLVADDQLRNHGTASIIHSFRTLSIELSRPKFEVSALTTILLLASWARWNGGFGRGKTHLKGAFAILRAIGSQRRNIEWKPSAADVHTFLFLASTFLHMDALSDLVQSTISEENPRTLTKFRVLTGGFPLIWENRLWILHLDRWSFGSLIPAELIYAAADLCYEVRMATIITSDIITKAEALKREVERYPPGTSVLSSATKHLSPLDKQYVVHTAEAYQYATLLFLHQVMPDIFGTTSNQYLARATVNQLSHSPPSCSVTHTQIYPLFVAGCEASTKQEREWIKERWAAMAARMRVTNVSNCWKITQEVWGRRDAYRQLRSENAQGVADHIDNMDPEFSVKGRLHWAAIMKDWNCEVSF